MIQEIDAPKYTHSSTHMLIYLYPRIFETLPSSWGQFSWQGLEYEPIELPEMHWTLVDYIKKIKKIPDQAFSPNLTGISLCSFPLPHTITCSLMLFACLWWRGSAWVCVRVCMCGIMGMCVCSIDVFQWCACVCCLLPKKSCTFIEVCDLFNKCVVSITDLIWDTPTQIKQTIHVASWITKMQLNNAI